MSDINPGEWQVDETGRRFRMVGYIKEFEPTIVIGGVEVPESQVKEFNARNKAAREAAIKAEHEAAREVCTCAGSDKE